MLAELGERLGFDLTDTFTGDGEFLADLLERVAFAVVQAEPHADDLLLTVAECRQDRLDLFLQQLIGSRFLRRGRVFVLDEILQHAVLVLAVTADTGVEALDILLDLDDILDLFRFHLEFFGQLFDGRLAVELLGHAALGAEQFVDRLDHVDWDTNRARLVSDGTSNRLADPPCRVGAKFKAFVRIELLDGA